MSELGAGVSSTDTAALNNLFHFALNDSLARMGLGDSDVASFTNDQIRIASIGTQMYVTKALVKRFISIPRMNSDQVSRDHFARVMELLRWTAKEFEDALSGADVPVEISRPSESIQTWGSPSDGAGQHSAEGNNYQRNPGEFYISEFGEDLTDYNDDGE